jgi:ATP-dependent exoDNAse (exonuclease V) alpha subunit
MMDAIARLNEINNIRTGLRVAQTQIEVALSRLAKLEQDIYSETKPSVSVADLTPPKSLGGMRDFLSSTSADIDLPGARAMTKAAEPTKQAAAPVIEVEEPITVTAEWQAVIDDVNKGTGHLFITGGAGTGKSTLLNQLVKTRWGDSATVAPTGVAALRVNGETIHRFFGFGAHALQKDDIRELPDDRKYKFKALKLLFIDEISMVRADLMDAIDIFLRKNGSDKDKPFGGTRIIAIGDLYQLPPVSSNKEKEVQQWLEHRYGTDTPYFFHADVWRDNPIKIHNLTTIFRQKDPVFTEALNAIRKGNVSAVHRSTINKRFQLAFKPPVEEMWITLTTTNENADKANQAMLSELPGEAETFVADVIGEFELNNAPTDVELSLKVGAAVMFVKNNKMYGWVNGTMGKVTSVKPLKVEIAGQGVVAVEKETWESITYEYDTETKKLAKHVKGKFVQVPLRLAAAITIHKSQGLTLDRLIVDLHNGAFTAGQTYVALSRARTLEGLVLRKYVREKDLITSLEVIKFMNGQPIVRPGPHQLTLADTSIAPKTEEPPKLTA